MQNYAGSVALCRASGLVAISSPRGGLVQMFDTATGAYAGSYASADVCGLASTPEGFLTTAGTGQISGLQGRAEDWSRAHALQWDNHLVPIG